jgi:hypothetical protein
MAASAIAGETGSDLREHRDYRAVDVLSAWLWDDELGLGVTSQVDLVEALLTYLDSRNSLLPLLGVTAVLSIMASLPRSRSGASLSAAARSRSCVSPARWPKKRTAPRALF